MAKQKDMKPSDLHDLAQKIRYVAERYEKVAEQMLKRKIPVLTIKGVDTVLNEIIPNRLAANAGSAERALSRWSGKPEATDTPPAVNLAAEANETYRKVSSRSKKKGS